MHKEPDGRDPTRSNAPSPAQLSDQTRENLDTALQTTNGVMKIRVEVGHVELEAARQYLRGRHRNAAIELFEMNSEVCNG